MSARLKPFNQLSTFGAFTGRPTQQAFSSILLRQSSLRLATFALLMAGLLMVSLITYYAIRLLGGPVLADQLGRKDTLVLMATFVSLCVYFLARFERIEGHRIPDIGLGYEIALGGLLGLGFRLLSDPSALPAGGVSWICVLILVFPVIVPNTPGKTLAAALIVASMEPLAIVIMKSQTRLVPSWASVFEAYHPNFICAWLAFVLSHILYRLGREASRAHELGSYRLQELVGKGSMGEVWKASHCMLARQAAVKIIRREALQVANAEAQRILQRFKREAEATASLESPHTVRLYDFGITDDNRFYYVMELLRGMDMHSLVRRYGPVSPERVVMLLRQICHSLADAHVRGLVHRDIKPSNILVCRRGLDYDFIKVLDFGIVRLVRGEDVGETFRTDARTLVGTPAFMAPEMIRGTAPFDNRVDIYALGCTAYWLLTGQTVFEAENTMDLLVHHMQSAPVPPSARTELLIPQGLEELILACLEKEPSDRPQSAKEVVRGLDECGLAGLWTPERALEWWQLHEPSLAEDE